MKFDKALKNIADNVKQYRQLEIKTHSGKTLNEILKQISATLFYLETERAEFHDKYQNQLKVFMDSGMSFNKAEVETNVLIPEMYLLRRVMDAAYKCIESIRSNLSWLKSEKNISNG